MFVNYVANGERPTPLNLAVARVLLSGYLIWKTLSYDWVAVGVWPLAAYRAEFSGEWPLAVVEPFTLPGGTVTILPLEATIAAAVLVGVAVGYRLRITTYLASILLTHLGLVRLGLNPSGGTEAYFIAVYFLLLFGLFGDQDELALDAVRRTGDATLGELTEGPGTDEDRVYRMDALKWGLVTLAVLYFWAGWAKIVHGPLLEWTTAENLARYILFDDPMGRNPLPLRDFLLEHETLLWASTWGTILLECGLLVSVLLGVTVTPALGGLVGMHTVIVLGMGPFFFDEIVFILLFVSWDRAYGRLASEDSVTVVYDDDCRLCVDLLHFVDRMDTAGAVVFHPRPSDTGQSLDVPDVDPEEGLWVVDGTSTFAGFAAIRRLARLNWTFRPVYWVMRLPPVEYVGDHVYRRLMAR